MKKQWSEWAWDAWCIASGIGIWPRYIEPGLLEITHHTVSITNLAKELNGFKVLQFSDLHWNNLFSSSLQKKMIRKINALEPDLIVFTGDFICRSKLENPEGLKNTLKALKAKIGCFAVLGNHDYDRFVTVNAKGDYDIEDFSCSSNITKGFKRLFQPVVLTKHVTERARQVLQHAELIKLLKETPFKLLCNETQQVAYNDSWINICGLEEYTLGKLDVDKAFRNYDERYPGIILSHNPDTFEILKNYPGQMILSGHTHGGQVNLPGLWPRFTLIENLQFKSGLKKVGEKWAYINRGISSVMKFRWFAAPELTLLTLQKG